MARRDYSHISLPYSVSSWILPYAIRKIVDAGFWGDLPDDLRHRLNNAAKAGDGFTITEHDLDSLNDKAWTELNELIGGSPAVERPDNVS